MSRSNQVVEQGVVPSRRRGRPRGRTVQGEQTRQHLYEVAVRLIATRGWQQTTLRDVAAEAGVSVGLLYRYFPSKRAVVLALYDQLSATYAERAAARAECLRRVGDGSDRCAARATGTGPGPPAVPRPPGGPALVAAGQKPRTARNPIALDPTGKRRAA